MSSQKAKWFKSTFSQESENKIPTKIPRKSKSCLDEELIDLTDDFNDEELLDSKEKSFISQEIKSLKAKEDFQKLLSTDWLELFAPQTIDDLAIHQKKITEVQNWIKHYESIKNKYPSQILLICGPAGCGKTATIRVVAKSLNYELNEWINPVDIDTLFTDSFSTENRSNTEPQISLFKRFLFQSSRYKSILTDNSKRIILVEDFPNIFVKNTTEFYNLLDEYSYYGKSPLIFTITDSKRRDLNFAYNLFPDDMKCKYKISEISFNPVSTTLMKKALKRITSKMKDDYFENSEFLKIPNDDILDNINITVQGDIRSAVLNLHLVSLKGVPEFKKEIAKSSNLNNTKRSKSKKLKSIGKDESITTIHAIGRVMYPKYVIENSIKKLIHSPEEIADTFSSEAKTFINLVHANYLLHFKCIEDLVNAADILSLSDIIMNEFRLEDFNSIGLNLGIRGVMISNESSSGSWAPIRGIYKYNNRKLHEESEKYKKKMNITNNVFATDFDSYIKVIFGCKS